MSDAVDLGYSKNEIMIVASARLLGGVQNCFVGVGLPNIVCNLAQRIVAKELQLVYESGVFGARPERLPLSIGDPTLATGSTAVTSMFELFAFYLQAGLIDVAFLGGRADRPVREPEHHGDRRLRDTEGAAARVGGRVRDRDPRPADPGDHATGAALFVEALDFRTSPGHSGDPEHDRARGWSGSGPTSVVTDLGTFGFDDATGEMTLLTLHPGVTLEDVRANTGWEPRISPDLGETRSPTDEELRLIREELDPLGVSTT